MSPFAPENLVSPRDGFDRPVPRQPAHSPRGIPSDFHGGVLLFIYTAIIRHRVSHEFIKSRNCVPMTFTAESPPAQGPQSCYVYMLIIPYSKSMDQPGKVANPAHGQVIRENICFPCSPSLLFARENLVSRGGFGRLAPHQPAHSPHSG